MPWTEVLHTAKQWLTANNCRHKFPGAFVIAVKDSAIIPLEQALKEISLTTKTN